MATAFRSGGLTIPISPTSRTTIDVTTPTGFNGTATEYLCPANTIAFIKFCGDNCTVPIGTPNTQRYRFGAFGIYNLGGEVDSGGGGLAIVTPDPKDWGQWPAAYAPAGYQSVVNLPQDSGQMGFYGLNYFCYGAITNGYGGWFTLLPNQAFTYTFANQTGSNVCTFRYELVTFTGV